MPLSLPPIPPIPLVIIFVCVQLPALSLSMLFSPAGGDDHVMRTTPRKRKLVRRPKDESRFKNYLAARVGIVCVAVFVGMYSHCPSLMVIDIPLCYHAYLVGWIASCSDYDEDNDRNDFGALARLGRFHDVLHDGVLTSSGAAHFWHVQVEYRQTPIVDYNM